MSAIVGVIPSHQQAGRQIQLPFTADTGPFGNTIAPFITQRCHRPKSNAWDAMRKVMHRFARSIRPAELDDLNKKKSLTTPVDG